MAGAESNVRPLFHSQVGFRGIICEQKIKVSVVGTSAEEVGEEDVIRSHLHLGADLYTGSIYFG